MKLFSNVFGGGGGQPTTTKRGRGIARAKEGRSGGGMRGGGQPAFTASSNRGVGINSAPGAGAKNAASLRRAGEKPARAR